MKKLLYSFLLGCSLLGCSSLSYHYSNDKVITTNKHIPVYIDVSFSIEEQKIILVAVKDWNYSLNGYIQFDVKSTSFDMEVDTIKEVYKNNNGVLILNKIDNIQDDWLAWTDHKNGTNHIDGHTINLLTSKIISRNKNLHKVILHELGHSLALDDTTIPNSLMNKNTNFDTDCVDEEAILQLSKKFNFDPAKMNYCKFNY